MRATTYLDGRAWRVFLLAALLCGAAASPFSEGRAQGDAGAQRQSYLLWKEGYLLHLQGEYGRAIERFERSIERFPSAEAHTYRGWSLSALGRLEEAIDACKAAIRIDPDYGNPYNDIGAYLIRMERAKEAVPWLKKAMRAKRYCC